MLVKKIMILVCALGIFLFSFAGAASAQQKQSWSQWVSGVRQEAIAQGIRPELFDQIFKNIKQPSRSILSYDRNQPEKRLTFLKYRATRGDNYRIMMGRKNFQKYKPLLSEIGYKYGVNPCFLVSFWGLETSYGTFMGKFPVIQSLATLAYDSRRAVFFRKELLLALQIVNKGDVKNEDFKGEWAGASGHPQFLPSSWHKYAVDYDGDGKKDIWKDYPDVFASIANYLVQNGWKKNQPWAIPVTVPASAMQFANQKIAKTVTEWRALGLKTVNEQPWPEDGSLSAKLIEPLGGPAFLTFTNFDVIMKWNHSTYYAGTVGYIAEKICGKPLYN